MQAIILLAGQGSRMGDLTKNNHKSLLPLDSQETFLSRLMHQLNEYEFSKVVVVTGYLNHLIEEELLKYQLKIEVVYNDRFKEDTNIYSMKLALDKVNTTEPVIVFEGDIWLEDIALKTIYETSIHNSSIWFTRGQFVSGLYGGILKKDANNKVEDVRIVPSFEERFNRYQKLVGIMTFGTDEINSYKQFLNKSILNEGIKQYYLIPWIDNLTSLPCLGIDLAQYKVESVNSDSEYTKLYQELNANNKQVKVDYVSIENLKPIEDFIKERANQLFDSIIRNEYWIKPIIVEKDHFLILDGHHRFEVAKRMGLKQIPVIFVTYSDIEIWSLRPDEKVTHELVINRALSGDIYPNKTVKHKFTFTLPKCNIPIKNLV